MLGLPWPVLMLTLSTAFVAGVFFGIHLTFAEIRRSVARGEVAFRKKGGRKEKK